MNIPQVVNMLGFWVCLNNSWICLSLTEYAGICLNGFCFTFPHCNPLSPWMCNHLSQCLHKTINYSLKEHEAVFMKRQSLIFFLVAGSIWINFWSTLNIFICKISNLLLLPLGTQGARGRKSLFTYN